MIPQKIVAGTSRKEVRMDLLENITATFNSLAILRNENR